MSITNLSSCKIAFRNAPEKYIDDCNKDRNVCIRLCEDVFVLINKIEEEVGKMLDSCQIQKNVNMTMKGGRRALLSRVKLVRGSASGEESKREREYRRT